MCIRDRLGVFGCLVACDNKVQLGRQEQTPGTGGFSAGLGIQQQRNREKGAELQRSKQLRSTGI